jgi:glycosyltransferase involved in cell wall biosynthesis
VYRHGLGVLQHSRYARAVVAHFLGDEAARQTRVVPFAIGERRGSGRDAARMALNIPQTAHLTCSFGMIAPTKRPVDVLQAWFAAFGEDPAALLAFVGDSGHDVCRTVMETATALGVRARVILAGRTTKQVYLSWLDAADLALQLRCESRGETSAAIADCLSAGLPVVVNAHGASAELPQDAVVLLADDASISAIGAALGGLRQDPERGQRLQAASRDHATTALSPVATAAAYHDAIEYFTRHGKAARLQAALPALPASDHAEAARALAGSFSAIAPGRLLLDASHMATLDLGTGIQRVIREISRRVLIGTKPDRLADMVRLDGTLLRHARVFGAKLLGLSDHGLPEPPVLAGEGDTIVLMDNYGNISQQEVAELRGHHRRGAKIVVVIYDILPLQRPDWFPLDAVPLLRNWLHASLGVADAALCISRSVAEELDEWLRSDANPCLRTRPLDIGWFPLGADFYPPPTEEIVDRATELALASAALRPTLLMVGTVEPRKGYGQALAAFEQVWSEGLDIGLTIVGKPGWSTEALRARLAEHPETAGRLHWLQQPSDGSLARLYKHHSGLLAASEGEGFGLPIIEAARAGLPILARDMNVFREVAGESALWFAGSDPASLAAALRDWHRRALDGSLPDPAAIRACDWDESTAAFLDPILTDAWPMRWSR